MSSRSRSNVSSFSRSSSYEGSRSEIDYCIRTMNYLISTLGLYITPLMTLDDLQVEHLLGLHYFIPSGSASEDVSRMILSLKDKYGADKFSALDAGLISQKNPTQVRFVLENFHLILNHQIARASKTRQSKMLPSQSGNTSSFYVLPPLKNHRLAADSEQTQETIIDQDTTFESRVPDGFDDDTGDSFETIENFKINVVNETTTGDSDDDHTENTDVSSSSINGTSKPNETKVAPSQGTSSRSISKVNTPVSTQCYNNLYL